MGHSDDEKNAVAAIKLGKAFGLLADLFDRAIVLTNGDADKLAEARKLTNEAIKSAGGVDRGSLEGTEG